MGYMQAYRVGGNSAESAIRKISQLLTGEGIDCDELGDERPDIGCVLIDFTAGEELVRKTEQTVPQLPQIIVASTQLLGNKQLAIADEFVSPDLPAPEIIRRVQCMENLAVRIQEEVPEPKHTKILVDGGTEEDDAPLKNLAQILNDAEIAWEPLTEENDEEGTGIIYTYYRREGYARLLQRDYPGYVHIQMAPTAEMRAEALSVGDFSYVPNTLPEEITTRHTRLLHMINRLRNPENFKVDPLEHRSMNLLFIGDRNVGTDLRSRLDEGIEIKTLATVAGALIESKKHDAVLVFLGGKEDAKERFTFLQLMLKDKTTPPKALYFPKEAPDRIKAFCEQTGVTVIESQSPDEMRETLLGLWK
jgi:hypothetical protein